MLLMRPGIYQFMFKKIYIICNLSSQINISFL